MKIWFFTALVAALGIILVRLYFKVRTVRRSRAETWDEHMIAQLRSQGYAPFNDYRVDFFLALPDETAVQSARSRLEPEFTRGREALAGRALASVCTPPRPCGSSCRRCRKSAAA